MRRRPRQTVPLVSYTSNEFGPTDRVFCVVSEPLPLQATTLEAGKDKREQVTRLLDRIAAGKFRATLETEAVELTSIGNSYRIRHSETSQEPLAGSREVDYLFHRMFSFLRLVLSSTGRAT